MSEDLQRGLALVIATAIFGCVFTLLAVSSVWDNVNAAENAKDKMMIEQQFTEEEVVEYNEAYSVAMAIIGIIPMFTIMVGVGYALYTAASCCRKQWLHNGSSPGLSNEMLAYNDAVDELVSVYESYPLYQRYKEN